MKDYSLSATPLDNQKKKEIRRIEINGVDDGVLQAETLKKKKGHKTSKKIGDGTGLRKRIMGDAKKMPVVEKAWVARFDQRKKTWQMFFNETREQRLCRQGKGRTVQVPNLLPIGERHLPARGNQEPAPPNGSSTKGVFRDGGEGGGEKPRGEDPTIGATTKNGLTRISGPKERAIDGVMENATA